MTTERERIENMLAQGKITPAEAERLKAVLEKVAVAKPAQPASEPDYATKQYPKLAIAAIVLAAVSMALGVFGLLTALVGLVIGFNALRQINREPERYKGRWLAIMAIVLQAIPICVCITASVFSYYAWTTMPIADDVRIIRQDGTQVRVPQEVPKPPRNSAAIQRAGAQATLDLVKVGEAEITKYLKWKEQNPGKPWSPAVLTELPRIESEAVQIENVLIYFGNQKSFVCVARIKEEPSGVHLGQPQSSKDAACAKASCDYGVFVRDGQNVPGWWFTSALFAVPGHPENTGQVHMVISERKK